MNDPISFLSSVLALIGVWLAFDAGYRPHRVSLLRVRLLELRSDLFEAARAGQFGDNGCADPAYRHTRLLLDGSIRIADQMTLWRLFVLLWSSRCWIDRERVNARNVVFRRALMRHGDDARETIARVVRETDIAIVMHMLRVNAFGFALISVVEVAAGCFRAQQRARAFIVAKIVRNRRMLEALEQDALGGLERLERGHAA